MQRPFSNNFLCALSFSLCHLSVSFHCTRYCFWASSFVPPYTVALLTIPAWKINIIISIKLITISWNYRYGTMYIYIVYFLFVSKFFISIYPSLSFFLLHFTFLLLVLRLHCLLRWCSNFHWTGSFRHLALGKHDHNDYHGKFSNCKFNRQNAAT